MEFNEGFFDYEAFGARRDGDESPDGHAYGRSRREIVGVDVRRPNRGKNSSAGEGAA
jgi:hypothetical protein